MISLFFSFPLRFPRAVKLLRKTRSAWKAFFLNVALVQWILKLWLVLLQKQLCCPPTASFQPAENQLGRTRRLLSFAKRIAVLLKFQHVFVYLLTSLFYRYWSYLFNTQNDDLYRAMFASLVHWYNLVICWVLCRYCRLYLLNINHHHQKKKKKRRQRRRTAYTASGPLFRYGSEQSRIKT